MQVDLLALFADVFALLPNVGQHLRGQLGQIDWVQSLDILGFYRMHIEHAAIVQATA